MKQQNGHTAKPILWLNDVDHIKLADLFEGVLVHGSPGAGKTGKALDSKTPKDQCNKERADGSEE
jgi:hypothetical protein